MLRIPYHFKLVFYLFIVCLFFWQDSLNSTTLNVAIEREPTNLDPRCTNDLFSAQVQYLLYRGLFKEDKNGNIVFDLAKSYSVAKDCIVTITLKDALWSDGKKVTAKDFEKSIKEALSPNFLSSDVFILYTIKNAKKAKLGHACIEDVKIFAKSEKTLIIELEQKDKNFIKKLTSLIFHPYRKEVYSGPYCIQEHKHGNYINLKKNTKYEFKSNFTPDEIKFHFISNPDLAVQLFLKNQLDIVGHPYVAIPTSYKPYFKEKFSSYKKDVLGVKLIGFNCTNAFQNKLLRKAFAYSIDCEQIVKNITQQHEKVVSCFCDSSTKNQDQFDPNIANELFKISDNIPKPILIYANDEINHLIAQHIQKQLQSFGIKIYLEKVELTHLRQRLNQKDYDFCIISWFADFPDYKNIFERLKIKNNYKNITGFNFPKLNFNDEKILQDNVPVLPLFQINFQIFFQKKVKNINISSTGIVQLDKVVLSN